MSFGSLSPVDILLVGGVKCAGSEGAKAMAASKRLRRYFAGVQFLVPKRVNSSRLFFVALDRLQVIEQYLNYLWALYVSGCNNGATRLYASRSRLHFLFLAFYSSYCFLPTTTTQALPRNTSSPSQSHSLECLLVSSNPALASRSLSRRRSTERE